MKTKKTHHFAHQDPEKIGSQPLPKESTKKSLHTTSDVPDFVYRDLKRTGIIIGSFIFSLAILYGIQIKTDWLNPILKKFGL